MALNERDMALKQLQEDIMYLHDELERQDFNSALEEISNIKTLIEHIMRLPE